MGRDHLQFKSDCDRCLPSF
uniref:Uncharacterized protein n=1 Tax=Arundo donax TaxID=35708 RepID=A0A0A8ZTY6_ARUDO